MKSRPPLCALILAVACISRPAVAEQQSTASESMTIGVTVEPTCTVKVNPGERKPEDAIHMLCRNFRDSQPQPRLFETEPRDGHTVMGIGF
jgi:hypothetical protein